MSKGRFPSHSQHPLTACVPCAVKLCCWDTPPTTGAGGGALTVRGPRGGPQRTLCPARRRRHTHTCNSTNAFWVCWHWARVTGDDLTCDSSNSKRNVQFDLLSAIFHLHYPQHLPQKVMLPSNTETVNTQKETSPLTQDLGPKQALTFPHLHSSTHRG